MARIDYPGADDPTVMEASRLSHEIAVLILARTDKVNIALTALSNAITATMQFIPDSEFESALSCVVESARISRARSEAPPAKEMN